MENEQVKDYVMVELSAYSEGLVGATKTDFFMMRREEFEKVKEYLGERTDFYITKWEIEANRYDAEQVIEYFLGELPPSRR